MKKVIIYTLSDPDTGVVKYVGRTTNKLAYRLTNHINDAKKEGNKRATWIKSLTNRGVKPIIEEIDIAETWEESELLEQLYISLFKSWGFDLKNGTIGGEGPIGFKHTDEQRKAQSESRKGKNIGKDNPFFGKKHTEEAKKTIGEKALGRKHSEEVCEAQRLKQKDWKPNEYVTKRMIEVHGRRVIKLNLDFSYVDEYYTIKLASLDTPNSDSSKITLCCQGKRNTHAGFKWRYKEDY